MNIKKILMITFSLCFGLAMLSSLRNFIEFGFIHSLPYAFVGIVFLVLAGTINESIKKKRS